MRPLYLSLHAYVRRKLREKYGADVVPADGPIPAHLLGNPWAQQWDNTYPLVAPAGADPGFDLTEIKPASFRAVCLKSSLVRPTVYARSGPSER